MRTQVRRLLALLLVVVLLGSLPPATASSGPPLGPAGTAFYTPPARLPAHAGDVIWYRSTPFYSAPFIRSDALAWKVLYRSTTPTGGAVAVSGLVIVPKKPWSGPGPRPVVSYSPGTSGMADRCAVSRGVTVPGADPTSLYEAPFITMLLTKGWAVALTDYQGLGTPGNHTYAIGNALGRDALDVVRAAQRLPVAGLSAAAPVLIWGYSEGGGGAAWAAALASSYAPELKVRAAAFGGVPNDLASMARTLEKGPLGVLVAMAAIGLDTSYPELHLASYLSPAGKKALPLVEQTCLSEGLVMSPVVRVDSFTTSNPLDSAAWKARLEENNLGDRRPPGIPMFDYHGSYDEAVPFGQVKELRDSWCAQGANLTWRAVAGEHISTYASTASDAAAFLGDRLAGKPTSGNCA